MPKAITKPTSNAKPATKPAADEKANAAAKEAEKAARLRIVESAVPAAVKLITSNRTKVEAAKLSTLETLRGLKDLRDKHSLSRPEVKAMLKSALANVYCDGDEEQVSPQGNSTANTSLSRWLTILASKDEKHQPKIDKALDSNDYDMNVLYGIATKAIDPKTAKKKGKQGGARETKSKTIDDVETFKTELSALFAKAWNGEGTLDKYQGGLTMEEITDACAELGEDYLAQVEADGEDE